MWLGDIDRVVFEFMDLPMTLQEEVLIAMLQALKERHNGTLPPPIMAIVCTPDAQ